jgi:hypothetical protein
MTDLPELRWTRWRVNDVSFLPPFDSYTCSTHLGDSAVDVTGSNLFVRLRDDGVNNNRCVVIRRGPRGGYTRTNGSVEDALPFIALAWRGADRMPDSLLSWLSGIMDPMELLRFGATLAEGVIAPPSTGLHPLG